MAVGRPERGGGVFGAGKHGGLLSVERAEPEVGVSLVVDGGEGEGFTVGGNHDWACVEARGAECGLRRGRDVGANGKHGSVSTLRKIEEDCCGDGYKSGDSQQRAGEDCAWGSCWCNCGWGLRRMLGSADVVLVFFAVGRGTADLARALDRALAHGHFVEDGAESENVGL